MENVSLFAIVYGRVQGVYFRAFVQQQARTLGLTGYVKNLSGGNAIEIRAEGEKGKLEEMERLLYRGPQGARVGMVDAEWSSYSGKFNDFEVRY